MPKTVILDKYKVEVTQQPDDTFLAVCPQISGVYAEGKTYLDAILNVEDVLRISLELLGATQPTTHTQKKFSFEIPNPLCFGLTA